MNTRKVEIAAALLWWGGQVIGAKKERREREKYEIRKSIDF